MTQFFISYSRVDLPFVEQLYKRLRQMRPNARIWYDKAPDGLLGGDDWWEEIMEAIAECEIFLYVLSNDSVQSKYCEAEFSEALRLQKRIVTIQARDRTVLTPELSEIQYVDMKYGVDDPDALATLSGALERQLDLVQPAVKPLWQGVTRKPRADDVPARPENAPEVDTATLRIPVLPTPGATSATPRATSVMPGLTSAATRAPGTANRTLVVAVVSVVVLAVGGLLALLGNPGTEDVNALQLARTPVARNAAWTPVTQTFDDGIPMVLVPRGCFAMGSRDYSDEIPVAQICIDAPFWLDYSEVMQADFARVEGRKAARNQFEGSRRPVENIDWFEARDFCLRRGGRLPTEAEWEFAARGPDGLQYPWGNAWDANLAIWARSASDGTATVGLQPGGASWVGAVDMAGNVWEWVSSRYEPYPFDAEDGREVDPPRGTEELRVLRGGAWNFDVPELLRSAARNFDAPSTSVDNLGVRCARNVE